MYEKRKSLKSKTEKQESSLSIGQIKLIRLFPLLVVSVLYNN